MAKGIKTEPHHRAVHAASACPNISLGLLAAGQLLLKRQLPDDRWLHPVCLIPPLVLREQLIKQARRETPWLGCESKEPRGATYKEKLSMQESLPDHTYTHWHVCDATNTWRHSQFIALLYTQTHTHHSTLLPAGEPDRPAQLAYPNVDSPVGENCRRDLPHHRRQCREWSGTSRSSFISPQGTNTNLSNK